MQSKFHQNLFNDQWFSANDNKFDSTFSEKSIFVQRYAWMQKDKHLRVQLDPPVSDERCLSRKMITFSSCVKKVSYVPPSHTAPESAKSVKSIGQNLDKMKVWSRKYRISIGWRNKIWAKILGKWCVWKYVTELSLFWWPEQPMLPKNEWGGMFIFDKKRLSKKMIMFSNCVKNI